MKKIWMVFATALLMLVLAACGDDTKTTDDSTKDADALSIYTTVYPLQYFAERIGGDYVNVQSIYPAGANEHSFEPTQKDMIHLADADLFFYIGLGLEGFVSNAEKTLANENVKAGLNYYKYKTFIPRSIRFAEAPSFGLPINLYDSNSKAAESYRNLAKEFIKVTNEE